jgi:formylglycine-generating enzyme required for sulfatase activity
MMSNVTSSCLTAATLVLFAINLAVAGQQSQTVVTFHDCPECPEMVMIPAGNFMMGSPPTEVGHETNEGPQHRVTIQRPFAAGKYEVTFAEWDACVDGGGCRNYRPDDKGWGRGRRPVMNVSWDDAQSYVAWLSTKTGKTFRLLSESEWEYAARAGSTTSYYFGDDVAQLPQYAWFDQDNGPTHPVGEKQPNRLGLFDMHGNVQEWVQDLATANYSGAPTDGRAVQASVDVFRVYRGGGYSNSAVKLRSADRDGFFPGFRADSIGFRVARSVP